MLNLHGPGFCPQQCQMVLQIISCCLCKFYITYSVTSMLVRSVKGSFFITFHLVRLAMSWISLPRLFHSGCFLLRAKKKTFAVYVLPTTCFLSSLLCVISAEITLNPKRTQTFSFFLFLAHRNVHEHFHLKTLWLNQTFPQLITATSVQFSVFVTLKGCWDLFVALMTDSLSDIWVMFWLVTSVHLNLYLHFLALLKETPFKTTNPVVFVIIYRQTWE